MYVLRSPHKDLNQLNGRIDCPGLNSVVFYYQCDITDRIKVMEVAEQIQRDIGHPTMLLNNAGIVSGQSILSLKPEKIQKYYFVIVEVPVQHTHSCSRARTMDVNAISHFWTIQAFLPQMIKENNGHIVRSTLCIQTVE